jgi:hypothetical protein
MSGMNTIRKVQAGLKAKAVAVAATGSTQADAAVLKAVVHRVTGADGTKGVRLRDDANFAVVLNAVTNQVLKVWPDVNTRNARKIDAGADNAAYSLLAGQKMMFYRDDAGDWHTLAASDFGSAGAKMDVLAESTAGSGVTIDSLLCKDGGFPSGFNFPSVARTASADGTGTGTIAAAGMIQFVAVTSANSAHIVKLPTPTPGTVVILHNAANGYQLTTSDIANVALNGGSGAGKKVAITAGDTVIAYCASATAWKALKQASDGTLASVGAAA